MELAASSCGGVFQWQGQGWGKGKCNTEIPLLTTWSRALRTSDRAKSWPSNRTLTKTTNSFTPPVFIIVTMMMKVYRLTAIWVLFQETMLLIVSESRDKRLGHLLFFEWDNLSTQLTVGMTCGGREVKWGPTTIFSKVICQLHVITAIYRMDLCHWI